MSEHRRLTNDDEQPSGLDLEQVDFPENNSFVEEFEVDQILTGLNWYSKFQIKLLKKFKSKDAFAPVIIEKIQAEMKQSEYVLYTEFQKAQDAGEQFQMESFNKMELQALMQLLGVFMPIVKLSGTDRYMLGSEVKQVLVRGQNCVVRVGGGFADIPEYYNKYSIKQCTELYHHISSRQLTFQDAVIDLAMKNNADDKVLEAYQADNAEQWDNVNTIFLLLSAFFEEMKNKENSAKKRSGKKGKKKTGTPSDGLSPVKDSRSFVDNIDLL